MVDFHIIGRRIKFYRKRSGLTQASIAEILGVSNGYISQIERGTAVVSLMRLNEIAKIINTDIVNLLSDTDETSLQYLNSELYQITKDWTSDKKKLLLKIAAVIEEE